MSWWAWLIIGVVAWGAIVFTALIAFAVKGTRQASKFIGEVHADLDRGPNLGPSRRTERPIEVRRRTR